MYKFILFVGACLATELTFELKEKAEECFYESLKKDDETIFEFQVIFFSNLKLKYFLLYIRAFNKNIFAKCFLVYVLP